MFPWISFEKWSTKRTLNWTYHRVYRRPYPQEFQREFQRWTPFVLVVPRWIGGDLVPRGVDDTATPWSGAPCGPCSVPATGYCLSCCALLCPECQSDDGKLCPDCTPSPSRIGG